MLCALVFLVFKILENVLVLLLSVFSSGVQAELVQIWTLFLENDVLERDYSISSSSRIGFCRPSTLSSKTIHMLMPDQLENLAQAVRGTQKVTNGLLISSIKLLVYDYCIHGYRVNALGWH